MHASSGGDFAGLGGIAAQVSSAIADATSFLMPGTVSLQSLLVLFLLLYD